LSLQAVKRLISGTTKWEVLTKFWEFLATLPMSDVRPGSVWIYQ